MTTGDRPLVQRLARAVQELVVGAGTLHDVAARQRLSPLLLNDARHAFGSYAAKNGRPLTAGAMVDEEFVLTWARDYLLEWSNVRRPPVEKGPAAEAPVIPQPEVFVGDAGSTFVDAADAYFNAELTEREQLPDAPTEENDTLMGAPELWRERASGEGIGAILLVEDESFRAGDYGRTLSALGFQVTYAVNPAAALRAVSEGYFDVVVVDIRMPNRPVYDDFEAVNGYRTGMLLAADLADNGNVGTLVALTNSQDALDEQWFLAHEGYHFCVKDRFPPDRFARYMAVNVMQRFEYLKSFIVHGRAKTLVAELQQLLEKHLKFKEPVVLWEASSKGRVVIEKFEYYASISDLVFVLLTPDETRDAGELPAAARPNVLYEAGYFHALLGRLTGRLILLYHKDVEFPSDLHGAIYIDITDGITPVWSQIETELKGVFGPQINL